MEYPWKVTWEERAELASLLAENPSYVIDVGGGLGTLKKVMCPERYLSLDLEKWTEETLVCDLNKELPDCEPCDCIICLGVLEYIEDPERFLASLSKYGRKMVISYRRLSKGGMPRANDFTFDEFESLITKAGWRVIKAENLNPKEKVYLTLFDEERINHG